MITYRAFGMYIETKLPLPMLDTCPPHDNPDLLITADEIPRSSPGGILVKRHAHIKGLEAWLNFTGVGRFWVNNGREIRTTPVPERDDQDWYFHLLGPAFLCALTQRDKLPLHACALLVNGKAVLVLGQSGTGKSTLAIGMDKLGIPVLSDDLCAVSISAENMIGVSSAYPYVKLHSPPDWLMPVRPLWHHAHNRRLKNYFALETPVPNTVFPLSAVYVLEQGCATTFEHLSVEQAEGELHANTQRRALYRAIKGAQAHRVWCQTLAEKIPAFRFSRRYNSGAFFSELQQLIEHASGL